jgi:hypothetical protein
MLRRTIFVGLLAVAALGAAITPVMANDADVIKRGSCSGASDWKLKLSPENGKIEVEFEVDQNRNNRPWRVVIKQNGEKVFAGTRYTQSPSGSFTVRILRPNTAGADRFVGRATNLNSGEVCRGVATF